MKQSIGSDAVKLTTSQIITMTISMITAMLLSRFRTLEEFGTYSQILMVINLSTAIFMLGLPNSINYFLAKAESDKDGQKFLSVYYTMSTILSLLTGLILVLSTPLIIEYFNNPLIKNFMYVLALYPWTKIIIASIERVFIVYQRTKYLMVFRVVNSFFLLLIVIVVEALNWDFMMYMRLFVIVEAIFALSVYIITRNISGKLMVSIDIGLINSIFKFSVPIGLASVVGTLKKEFDKLVIAGFFDTEQVAIYANAARELPITVIASSLTAVLLPQMVRLLKKGKKHEALSLWGDSISLSYLIICFLAAGIFVYAPEVVTLLYSDKYRAGVSVFRIYSLVLIFRCTYFGMILNSTGKTRTILYSSIAALVVNIILNFVFYYLFGFIGPAVATLVATLLSAGYLLWNTSKILNVNFINIFPWRNILLITILNIVMGCIFYLLKEIIRLEQHLNEILESIILGGIWGLVYTALTYKFARRKWNILNREN